jgi:signal transduction histidine kinase
MGTLEIGKVLDQKFRLPSKNEHLGSPVLLHNAVWFTKVRWIVVAVFIAAGLTGILIPGPLLKIGWTIPSKWLFILAGSLLVINSLFYFLVSKLTVDLPGRTIETNIWLQITADLLVVTALVHIIGSTDTFVAFAYLFHIAIACIFFPPKGSFFVTLLAVGLYMTLIIAEVTKLWASTSVLDIRLINIDKDPLMTIIFALTAVFVWLVTWIFISNLSKAVRMRDQQLSIANEQLIAAGLEKTQQVLMTTHELKAPFSGIESNIQVLKFQFWDEIPESVHGIIDKIEARSKTLRERIGQILILGDIKSKADIESEIEPVNLSESINEMASLVSEKAESRDVTVDIDVSPVTVPGNRQHLNILFSNLISNAIIYSHEGGKVEVKTEKNNDSEVSILVIDHGIGIRDDALPHIFEAYYRTKEGAKFNKTSTGLGLSMVKEIAIKHGINIIVNSEIDKGTTFEVIIPKKMKSIKTGG